MRGKGFKALLCLLITASMIPAYGQNTDTSAVQSPPEAGFFKRWWHGLIHGNVDRTHEKKFDVSFAVAPSYSREGSIGFGGTATGLYRLDMKDSTMAPSNVALSGNASIKGFYSLIASGTNYFTDKHSKLTYGVKFTRKVLDFWGIDFDACAVNPTSQYTRSQFRTDADYSYRFGRHIYLGAALNLNYTAGANIYDPQYLEGQRPSYFLTGVGLSFQYDSRDNPTNPHKGLYFLAKETIYPKFLGNSGMTTFATSVVLCGYVPTWHGAIIAGDLYAQIGSENAVWTLREELGGVSGRMRGYYAGRYIDSSQIAAQIEIRQHIASRFGCVAWAGAGTVFGSIKKFDPKHILPTYGIGLRVEFKHNMNLRIDFGLGKDTAGLVFGFSEAF